MDDILNSEFKPHYEDVEVEVALTRESDFTDSLSELNDSMFKLNATIALQENAEGINFVEVPTSEDAITLAGQYAGLEAQFNGGKLPTTVNGRIGEYTATQEGIVEMAKKAWAYIVKMFKKVIKWIKTTAIKMYSAVVTWISSLDKLAAKLGEVGEIEKKYDEKGLDKLISKFGNATTALGYEKSLDKYLDTLDKRSSASDKGKETYMKELSALLDNLKVQDKIAEGVTKNDSTGIKGLVTDIKNYFNGPDTSFNSVYDNLVVDSSFNFSGEYVDNKDFGIKESSTKLKLVNADLFENKVSVLSINETEGGLTKFNISKKECTKTVLSKIKYDVVPADKVQLFVETVIKLTKGANDDIKTNVKFIEELEGKIDGLVKSNVALVDSVNNAKEIDPADSNEVKKAATNTRQVGNEAIQISTDILTTDILRNVRMVKAASTIGKLTLSMAVK